MPDPTAPHDPLPPTAVVDAVPVAAGTVPAATDAAAAAETPSAAGAPSAPPGGRRVLERMLDRLFAALVDGPGMNCRPHRSRQRVDWFGLSALNDVDPAEALRELLGEDRKVVLRARVPTRKEKGASPGSRRGDVEPGRQRDRDADDEPLTDQPTDQLTDAANVARPQAAAGPVADARADAHDGADARDRLASSDAGDADPRDAQAKLLQKLHGIAEDARTYEQDTGVHVLNVGFPLLSLPPAFAQAAGGGRPSTRRVLAPIAYVPVSLTLRRGATRIVEVACRGEGIDLVQPNTALLAWLQRQTGNPVVPPGPDGRPAAEPFADEKGEDPWREIRELVRQVCRMVDLPVPHGFEIVGESATEAASAPATAGADAPARAPTPVATPTKTAPPTPGAVPPDSAGAPVTSIEGEPVGTAPDADGEKDAQPDAPARDAGRAPTDDDHDHRPVRASVALELSPAARSDDLEDGPQILAAAVLGLFPVAKQGLLRDAQALAEEPGAIVGPLERFIRLGALLDASAPRAATGADATAGDAAVPAAAKREAGTPDARLAADARRAADERLVADADPCQARAVRLARHSPALVIHGPPGTGKSQTIANIIGDHLARGQRVLFACEKRTALDVVAGRLEHMGLGDLVGVVHDPQRDQRDLYRKIRDQLEKLAERTTDPRAADRLRHTDDELQRLRAELTGYQAALTRLDPDTGQSFHELMGQWLAASPVSVVGAGDPAAGPGLDIFDPGHDTDPLDQGPGGAVPVISGTGGLVASATRSDTEVAPVQKSARRFTASFAVGREANAALAKVRLRDLAPLEHPLGEAFARARQVGYADNPWAPAVGVGLAPLLAKPVDQHRSAVAAVVAAAAVADQTAADREPALPPFSAGVGLTAQAAARVELADRLAHMLDQCPPDVLDRWAARPPAAIKVARARLAEAEPYLAALETQPVDRDLAPRWLAAVGQDLPDTATLSTQRRTLQAYADAFATSMQWVDEIKKRALRSTWPTIAYWVSTDTASAAGTLRRLEVVAPMAAQAAAAPLDADLLAQFRRQPFDFGQLLRWQAALETYLPVAGSMFGFLHGAKKKAAAPAVEFFGLGLSAESATRVRDFLAALRLRMGVWETMGVALGPRALGRQTLGGASHLPEDPELLGTFDDHLAVLRAAADLARPAVPAAAAAADPPALVNHMVSAELAAAGPALAALGLGPAPDAARRAAAFLQAVTVRVILQGVNENVLRAPTPDGLMDDHDLAISILGHMALFDVALAAAADANTRDVWPTVAAALQGRGDALTSLLAGLRLSPKRAADVVALGRALASAGLFAPAWLAAADADLRVGKPFAFVAAALRDKLPTLEDVVRVREAVDQLPPPVRPAAAELLAAAADPAEAWDVLRRDVLAGEIRRRLAGDPRLQDVDGHRLASAFDRYRKLEEKKRQLVRDVVVDQWVNVQKDRLLSDTGKRLSPAGTELGRRLLLRGEKAIRLRQVVQRGRGIAGGDPLFDVCPVWMVSPETAAQVFPREPIFDVVVFDEASQCRLEEALPVLTRGKRVVIAGDPKQLPPTRFFETAFAASEDDEEPTDDQGWFEQQQAEVEDLLTAALGLDAHQSYLDVHYRSKHAALIGFSNEHFYGSRLQPIPGHPSLRPTVPPIRLVRVANAVYAKRRNEPEADAVVALVKELLSDRKPPSIGIACFNMVQRDLIVERLDDAAAADAKFAKKLSEARERVGAGSFEGLFVKNLENVQGDERDHLIVSTTYGPDAAGKFRRQFGPLAMPGGGRRLNVLVTRARQQVHLVTSIPPEAYRILPDPADGQTPGGGWLLFAYLRYADALAREYAEAGEADAASTVPVAPNVPDDGTMADAPPTSAGGPAVRVRQSRAPSAFAEALADKLAAGRGAGSDVYWGNDGFCVDLVVRPPLAADAGGDAGAGDDARPALGVLCDAARFAPADDLMEWDVFRTGILEAQGWALHRVWTPHFFRDPQGRTAALVDEAGKQA
jgi:hypothetical protein